MRSFSQFSVAYQNLTNITSRSSTRTYSNSPISDKKLLILSITLSLVALLGIITNTIVVFITRKESRYEGPIEEKRRRSLVSYLIYNLSLSDLLGSLFSCPCIIVQQYIYSLQTQVGCSTLRLIAYLFPTLSTQILAIICLERYINLVFPFRNFPVKLTKCMIKCAWVFAAFWSLAIAFTFKVNIELQGDFYIWHCAHDLEDSTKKAFYLTSLSFTFVLPLIIICFSTIRSATIVRKFKCEYREPNPSAVVGLTERKVRSTWLVIWLVVIFGATCFPFAVYQGIKSFRDKSVSYSTDFTVRYICTILVFSNGVINPFMYYKNLKNIRQKMNELLGRRLRMKPNPAKVHTITFENATYKPESLLQVPKVSLFEGRADGMQGTSVGSSTSILCGLPVKTEERIENFSHIQLSVLNCPQQTVSID